MESAAGTENIMTLSTSTSALPHRLLPPRGVWAVAICVLWGGGPAASWCAGQIIESAPPAQQPKNSPAQTTAPPPIIQTQPMTENAAPPKDKPASPLFLDPLTKETVQTRLKEATEDPNLDKAQKEKITSLYQQALNDLAEAQLQEAKAAEYAKQTQDLPAQIQDAKKTKEALEKQALAQPPNKQAQEEIPPQATLTELQQELTAREEKLSNAKKRFDDAVNVQKSIATQQNDLTGQRKAAQDRLAETEQQLKSLPANTGTAMPQTLAERTQLRARWQLLQASLSRLDKEETWRKERMALVPLERDIAAKHVLRLEPVVQSWRKAVTAKRQDELEQQKAEAQAQARAARPFKQYASIGEHARKIVELAELRQKTATEIPQVVKELDSAKEQSESAGRQFQAEPRAGHGGGEHDERGHAAPTPAEKIAQRPQVGTEHPRPPG